MFLYLEGTVNRLDEILRSRLEPGHLEATAAIHCAYLIMRCDQVRDLPEILQKRWWNRIAGLAEQVLAVVRSARHRAVGDVVLVVLRGECQRARHRRGVLLVADGRARIRATSASRSISCSS